MRLGQWRNRCWLGLVAALAGLGAPACGAAPVGAQAPAASATTTAVTARAATPTVAVPAPPPDDAEVSVRGDDQGADSRAAAGGSEGGELAVRSGGRAPSGGALDVELYIMSKCPYAAQVIPGIAELARSLGPRANVTVGYIGTVDAKGELSSMHGPTEVEADLAQVCAGKIAPARQLAMMACQTRAGYAQAEATVGACAAEAGIPVASLRACIASGEGARLLAASFARSTARGAKGSPTIFIGGDRYEGHRSATAFLRAACGKLSPPADACLRLARVPRVNVVLLSDRRCTDCRATSLSSQVRNSIDNPEIRELDYGDAEGRKLFAATGSPGLPILVFDQSLEADADALQALQPRLKGQAPNRYLTGGTSWKPTCHDPGGCTRAECRADLGCRRENPGQLDLFMMSHCPFAAKALLSMPEVLRDLGPSVDLRVHYIGDRDAKGGFTSMHGAAEVDEDARQLCAAKHFAAKRTYLDYLVCRARDPRAPAWQACTKPATAVDSALLERCVSGAEGPKLLGESFGQARELDIGASPTWVVNNRYRHSGIDTATIERFFCEHNSTLPQCRSLAAAGPTSPASGPSASPPTGAATPTCQPSAAPGAGQCR